MDIGVIVIILVVLMLIGHRLFLSPEAHDKQARKLLSIDRICRNADIGEKEISISTLSYFDISAQKGSHPKHRHYKFRVSCNMPRAGSRDNSNIVVGKYEINLLMDSRSVEDRIVEDIRRIRERG